MWWKMLAGIGAASSASAGTYFTARNQKNAAYAGDVSIGQVQRDNITANLNNSPAYEAQARNINWAIQSGYMDQLEAIKPGYRQWTTEQSQKALRQSQGQVMKSDADTIERRGYEMNYASGVRGQARQFNIARDFGRAQFAGSESSQQIIQQLASLNKVNLSGVGDFYSSTSQAINAALTNRSALQASLNADQAAKNARKNAIWASSSAWANSQVQFQSQGKGTTTDEMNAYSTYDTAFMDA